MALSEAIGIMELVGLVSAIECADAAVKAANVKLIGYELSRGQGLVTVKISGKVGAVQAAVTAGSAAAEKVGKVAGKIIIPRPHQDLEKLIINRENVLYSQSEPEAALEQEPPGDEPPAPVEEPEIVAENQEADIEETPASSPVDEKPAAEPEKSEPPEAVVTCNICGDPACPRHKGEPHTTCIHAKDQK